VESGRHRGVHGQGRVVVRYCTCNLRRIDGKTGTCDSPLHWPRNSLTIHGFLSATRYGSNCCYCCLPRELASLFSARSTALLCEQYSFCSQNKIFLFSLRAPSHAIALSGKSGFGADLFLDCSISPTWEQHLTPTAVKGAVTAYHHAGHVVFPTVLRESPTSEDVEGSRGRSHVNNLDTVHDDEQASRRNRGRRVPRASAVCRSIRPSE
jgi:hypothetical protein